jgi:hypothetical protein
MSKNGPHVPKRDLDCILHIIGLVAGFYKGDSDEVANMDAIYPWAYSKSPGYKVTVSES